MFKLYIEKYDKLIKFKEIIKINSRYSFKMMDF